VKGIFARRKAIVAIGAHFTFHLSPLPYDILHRPSLAQPLTLLAPGFWLLTPLQFALDQFVRFNKARSA